MCALLANKRYELLYNCGIQLLHIGRPLAAFECLMEAVQVYHANPRLWLRLAECCIAANKGVSVTRTKREPMLSAQPVVLLVGEIANLTKMYRLLLSPRVISYIRKRDQKSIKTLAVSNPIVRFF